MERFDLLNSIGFEWGELLSEGWNGMYQRLVAYKKKHNGDTKVPFRYDQDPQLGKWVRNQRRAYRNSKMSMDRVRLLNSIGFDWILNRDRTPIHAAGAGARAAGSTEGTTVGAGAVVVAAAAAANQFRATAARLRRIARSATTKIAHSESAATITTKSAKNNADRVVDDIEKACKKFRRTSQVSRMLCATKEAGYDINLQAMKLEVTEIYSTSAAKLFSKKFSKSLAEALTPSF